MSDGHPLAGGLVHHAPERFEMSHSVVGAPKGAYLSISDTADYLGVTTRTIRQMIADGRLRGYKLGARVVRLRRDEIDSALRPFGGAA